MVIGSGMGGLTAALLLQQKGYDVTVLEQHYRPGGMLHRFFRQGAAFDTGFHYCGSVDAGQPLGQILRHLGVYDELDFHRLDPDGFDRLWFPDLTVDVPEGWEAYESRLKDTFPHEASGITAVIARLRQAVAAYSLYRMEPLVDPVPLIDAEGTLLVDVIREHVRDRRVEAVITGQAILYGVEPTQASLGVHALIMDHFLNGSFSVHGGGDKLALTLTRKLRRQGGRLLLRTEATRVECEGRKAVAVHAVHTQSAETMRLEADLVVSNLHPRLTLGLLPEEATRKAYRSRVADAELGHAHFGAYLRLSGGFPELGPRNLYRHRTWDGKKAYRSIEAGEVPLYFACSPTEHVPTDGDGVLLFVAPLAWEQVARWQGADPRPADYLAYKQQLLDTAIDALDADFPGLRDRILQAEASTPLSTEHYTRSPQGATYGHLHSRDQMGRYRPSQRVRVPNMVLVGQGVFSPGVLGVSLSAYYGVGQLLGLDPLLAELRSA